MKLIIILFIIVNANGLILNRSCPTDREVILDFDINRYLGRWYEIQRYEQPFEKDGDCCSAVYSLNDDNSVKLFNSMALLPNTTQGGVEGRAVLSYPNERPLAGKFNVTFGPSPPSSNYWILMTDYINYAVIYGCRDISVNMSAEAAWILSRQQQLNPLVQSTIDIYIDTFFLRNELRTTEQDKLICNYD